MSEPVLQPAPKKGMSTGAKIAIATGLTVVKAPAQAGPPPSPSSPIPSSSFAASAARACPRACITSNCSSMARSRKPSASDSACWRSSTDGYPTMTVTRNPTSREAGATWPAFLPDGRHVAYLVTANQPSRAGIWLTSLDAPASRTRLG